jgi:hypothetical protein
MEDVDLGIFWSFDIFSGYLVYFPCLTMLHEEKSGNPQSESNFFKEG